MLTILYRINNNKAHRFIIIDPAGIFHNANNIFKDIFFTIIGVNYREIVILFLGYTLIL